VVGRLRSFQRIRYGETEIGAPLVGREECERPYTKKASPSSGSSGSPECSSWSSTLSCPVGKLITIKRGICGRKILGKAADQHLHVCDVVINWVRMTFIVSKIKASKYRLSTPKRRIELNGVEIRFCLAVDASETHLDFSWSLYGQKRRAGLIHLSLLGLTRQAGVFWMPGSRRSMTLRIFCPRCGTSVYPLHNDRWVALTWISSTKNSPDICPRGQPCAVPARREGLQGRYSPGGPAEPSFCRLRRPIPQLSMVLGRSWGAPRPRVAVGDRSRCSCRERRRR
jgi:hypothetical protein